MAVVAISPDFNLHHHDSNGNPASGWLVYTFVSNTTTIKDSYSNPAGSIKHSNPIVLDARGEYPGKGLYLIAGEAYTLELRNPQNVPIKTVDRVFGTGAASGGTTTVTLPPHTAYANELEATYEAHPVEIVETLIGKDDALIVSVGAVNEGLSYKLNNTGNDTFDGSLTVTGRLTASEIETGMVKIDGTDINDIFVNEDGHTGRTLVGNKDASTGAVEDIPIANDLSSNSADVIPSVVAVVNGIADAITNMPNPDTYTVKASPSDTSPATLIEKLQGGTGINIETDNTVVTISIDGSDIPTTAVKAAYSGNPLTNPDYYDNVNSGAANYYWLKLPEVLDTSSIYDPSTGFITITQEGNYHIDVKCNAEFEYQQVNNSDPWEDKQVAVNMNYFVIRAGDVHPSSGDGARYQGAVPKNSYGYFYVPLAINGIIPDLRVGDRVGIEFTTDPRNEYTVPKQMNMRPFNPSFNLSLMSGIGAGSGAWNGSRVVYVSNAGSDTNDGMSPMSAKKLLPTACSTAKGKQMAEGDIHNWTVVCEDSSIFETTGFYIPSSISVYAPKATLIESTYLAIPEGTTFTFDNVSCDNGYTTGTAAGVHTTVNINNYTYTGNSDYGLITTGSYASTVVFNVGTIHGTATSQSGSGVIGCVSDGGAGTLKTVVFNVDTIKLEMTSYEGNPRSVLWNNANNTNNVFNIGSIFAPHMQFMFTNVGTGSMYATVGYSETEKMAGIYSASINTISGGYINCLSGALGQLENGPALKVNADYNAGTDFVTEGTSLPTLELSRPGKISIKGSDAPEHLIDKLVAGDNITITEVDGTLRFDSTASGDAVTGTGTKTHHTLWTGNDSIGDSVMQEDANGNIVTGGLTQLGVNAHNNEIRGGGNYLSGQCTNNDINGNGNSLTDDNSNHISGSNNFLAPGCNENVILGDSNILDNDVNDAAIIGQSNRIRESASQSQIIGHNNDVEGPDNIIIGDRNYMPEGYGEKVIIGNDNRVDAPEAMAFGTDNYESGGGGDSHMFGHANNLVNTSGCEVFGSTNDLDNVSGVMVFGKDIVVNDTQDNPNGVHIGAGGENGVLHIHGRIQGADNAYADAGKTIGFDANGQVIIVDPAISGLATYHYQTGGDVNGAFFLKRIVNATTPTNYQQFLVIDSAVCKMTALLSYYGDGEQPKVTVLTMTRRADSREGHITFKWAKGAANNATYIKVQTGWTGYQYNITLSSLETLQSNSSILGLDTSFTAEALFDAPNYQRFDVLNAGTNISIAIDQYGERTISASGGGASLWVAGTLGSETTTTPVTPANPVAVDQIAFNHITYDPTHVEGKLYFNTNSHSLQMDGQDSETHLEIGREQWLRVKNTSGSTITNGSVVVVTGGTTGLTDTVATIALAKADLRSTCHTIAFSTSTIANGAEGEVCTYGFTRGVNLNGFAQGTVLYVSPTTAGWLTATEPSYPYFSAKIGVVMKSGTADGVLFVSPDTDPNYQTGTGPGAAQGGETFAIAVADGTVSTNDQNGNGSYLSCIWIPKATITINGLACFCTQADRWTQGRMGIYTRGEANDVLVAQSPNRTTNLAVGFNTFQLSTPYTVQANTPYMLAVQFIGVVALGKATGSLSPNAPNHFSRVDTQNAPPTTTTMVASASYSPSTTRIWIGAY